MQRRFARLLGKKSSAWWPLLLAAQSACTSLEGGEDQVRPATRPDAAILLDGPSPAQSAGADAAVRSPGTDTTRPSCIDAQGFGGLGCWRCGTTDVVSLENACAEISCTPFVDETRLTRLVPGAPLPELPTLPTSTDAGVPNAPSPSESSKSCAEVAALGKPLYVTGSSAVRPFLEQIARQFVARGVYIIYTPTGSCVGVDAVLNGTLMTTGPAPAPSTHALYWSTPLSEGEKCQLPAAGVSADLGISDVFVQSCPGFEVADAEAKHVRDAHGPIQTMAFVVPANSAERELSAQAAYFVFGFGRDGGVLNAAGTAPVWNREEQLLQRQASSGTQALLSAAVGVPAARWKGKTHRTSDELAASLLAAASDVELANQTLGILGVDYIDSKNLRAQIRALAYRDTHQTCAVYPDSTETARDRRNVRDGHYPLWGPLHLLYGVNDAGLPANANTREELSEAIAYLAGTKPLPNGVQLIDVYAQSGLIPECAMRVTRSMDGGNIMPYRPDIPCACLFEARATGRTGCTVCKVQGDCAATETCAHGYCEP